MSSIITSVLNLTFGLLWNKVRDHTAKQLKEGDVTDEKCRQLIVKELDDITTKLDGLARKDLLSSVNFLEEGLTFLKLSQDESTDGKTSYPQEQKEDISQAEGSTMMVAGSSSVFNEACSLALSNEIGKLNIASGTPFASAKRCFEKSNTKATEAFSNEALSTEDRIMATKLQVFSRILESLEDPNAAANTCQLYLKKLHCLPAVREMFSVQLKGGMKSRFNKTKRLENVMSITMINFVVFNFTIKFTKMGASVWQWPSIEIGKGTYNPMGISGKVLTELEESGVQPPNTITTDRITNGRNVLAVNSKREMIGKMSEHATDIMKITAGEVLKFFCRLPPEDTETNGFKILSLVIDGEDNVYILTQREPTDYVYHYKLFVFDAKGNMKHQYPLPILNQNGSEDDDDYQPPIAITKDKKIITHGFDDEQMHVCDSSGELKYSFPTKELDLELLSISDENEIIAAEWLGKSVYIYTEEGNEKKTFKVPKDHTVMDLSFNHVTKEVIVLTCNTNRLEFWTSSYSTTGEKRQIVLSTFDASTVFLTSHPSGPVALVYDETILYIQ